MHYKVKLEMTEALHNPFFQPIFKLILLFSISSYCIIEIINLLYNIPNVNKYQFAIYYLHYNNKFVSNLTRIIVCTTKNFYFLSYFSNLSIISLFVCDGETYTTELGLVTKKKQLAKTGLYCLFYFF